MILTGIYALASLVISLMIPPVVNNHLSQILTNKDIVDKQGEYEATEDRRDQLILYGYIVAAAMAVFSVINLLLWKIFTAKEKSEVDDDSNVESSHRDLMASEGNNRDDF